jgi:hypothetical protein
MTDDGAARTRSPGTSLFAAALVLAPPELSSSPARADPTTTEAPTTKPSIDVTSVGCAIEDAELERLLVLELSDLPQAERGIALHVDLRCDFAEIGILVREPVRGISLQRTMVSPEAAVGRERVLALAIRQFVDTSFLELVTRDDPGPSLGPTPGPSPGPGPADRLDLPHGSKQASKVESRDQGSDDAADEPSAAPRSSVEPASAPTDLVASGGASPAEGPRAPAPDAPQLGDQLGDQPQLGDAPQLSPVRLGLELGSFARALETRPLAAARMAVFVEGRPNPRWRRWSLLGSLASDWSTTAELGGRLHAIDLAAGFGARARFPIRAGPFVARVGGDLELGWGRVFARPEPGFTSATVDSAVLSARVLAGIWAEGRHGALGLDLTLGGGPRTPIGTVANAGSITLGGVFVGLLVGASWGLDARGH